MTRLSSIASETAFLIQTNLWTSQSLAFLFVHMILFPRNSSRQPSSRGTSSSKSLYQSEQVANGNEDLMLRSLTPRNQNAATTA